MNKSTNGGNPSKLIQDWKDLRLGEDRKASPGKKFQKPQESSVLFWVV